MRLGGLPAATLRQYTSQESNLPLHAYQACVFNQFTRGACGERFHSPIIRYQLVKLRLWPESNWLIVGLQPTVEPFHSRKPGGSRTHLQRVYKTRSHDR